jgi:hypothetical protein
VIGEDKDCFSVHSENTVHEADVYFNTDGFMDIAGQLRKAELRNRLSESGGEC